MHVIFFKQEGCLRIGSVYLIKHQGSGFYYLPDLVLLKLKITKKIKTYRWEIHFRMFLSIFLFIRFSFSKNTKSLIPDNITI